MSVLKNGGMKYHKGSRFMRLKKGDHALVFRKGKGDGELEVELYIGMEKGQMTDGGLVLSVIGTNIFDQNFMDQINSQLSGITKATK